MIARLQGTLEDESVTRFAFFLNHQRYYVSKHIETQVQLPIAEHGLAAASEIERRSGFQQIEGN
jgi:hypothetical protein